MSTLFDRVIDIARVSAEHSLKRSAENRGTIITLCSVCRRFMGEKPGEGQSGISHSYCEECFPSQQEVQ